MSLWERAFAAGYDRFMAGAERADLGARRERLLSHARGRVLELGGGPGATPPHYPPAVTGLVLLEPSGPRAARLERKLADAPVPALVVRAPAEELPFEDGFFDTVVATLVLCTVTDPERVLDEVRRV